MKGYASHERGTLEAVVKARNSAIAAPGVDQKVAAENMLSGALRQLFALSEAYPDLKANTNFQQLQSELSDIENKLAASRRFFNNAVQSTTPASRTSRPSCSPRRSASTASSSSISARPARRSSRRRR